MKKFKQLQCLSFIKDEQMDDDCERGMYRAYNILACLERSKYIEKYIPGKDNHPLSIPHSKTILCKLIWQLQWIKE